MGKRFIDITQTISPELIVYPGDPPVAVQETASMKKGDRMNLSQLTFGSHTGTHIDAPKHFFDQGLTIEEILWEYLIGPVKVFEINTTDNIKKNDLLHLGIAKNEIILLKTRNSDLLRLKQFTPDYVSLTPEAANYLVEIGIRTLGIDYLSIDPFQSKDHEAHHIILGNGIIVIEGLDLYEVQPGNYQLIVLPLKIKNGNGSPARAVLMQE